MIGWFKKEQKWIDHDGKGDPFNDEHLPIDVVERSGKQFNGVTPWDCAGDFRWGPDDMRPEDVVRYRLRPNKKPRPF